MLPEARGDWLVDMLLLALWLVGMFLGLAVAAGVFEGISQWWRERKIRKYQKWY